MRLQSLTPNGVSKSGSNGLWRISREYSVCLKGVARAGVILRRSTPNGDRATQSRDEMPPMRESVLTAVNVYIYDS